MDTAADSRAGVDAFTAAQYDLVLMDVHMPVLDGLEATRAIRAWEREHGRPRTPIIALTASVMPDAAGWERRLPGERLHG